MNDNRLPPESTFYFTDSLLFDSVPIFVNWRADYPDRTKALTKISHRCDIGQRACGLKCCYGEADIVQKGFLELVNAGNLTEESTYTFNDVTYSLQLIDNSSTPKCTYYLSYYDKLFRKGTIDGKEVSTIYFSCPESFSCCGLRCIAPPATALLRKTRETNLLSFQFDRDRLNVLLTAGAVISLIAFVGITFINYRGARSRNDSKFRRCEMVDMQTSTFSLHDDIENLLTDSS
ncbi:hypothetical protein OSTOST_12712 [Ostertagia ostertagi]